MHLVFSERTLKRLFSSWSLDSLLFTPDTAGHLVVFDEFSGINLKKVPAWRSLKDFIFPPRRFAFENPPIKEKPVILVGVRACEIRGVNNILDRVFAGKSPEDAVYKKFRKNILIVSADCTDPADTCFCIQTGGAPFVSGGADINITVLKDGRYLLHPLTSEGERLLHYSEAPLAGEAEIRIKKDIRDTSVKRVRGNFNFDISTGISEERFREASVSEEFWEEASASCVQCGGCNFTCPTCYCTVSNELSSRNRFIKALQWDACLFRGYFSRAGKKHLLPKLSERFRHRYLCKLHLMYSEFGILGCVGCGRCIKACPGMIDMRKVIGGLYEY